MQKLKLEELLEEMSFNELVNLKTDHLNETQIFIEKSKGKKDRVVHCSPLVYKEYLKYKRLLILF